MFENLKNGWKLASATRKLIFNDKALLLYPVLSFIIAIVLAAAIFIPTVAFGVLSNGPIVFYLVVALVIYYIAVSFISTYLLIALLIAFRSYVKGNKISMGTALNMTKPYTIQILEWALFYTMLVMVLRVIESRFRGIARFLIAEIGSLAIAAASLFVVPVILDNKVGPITAIKDSVKTITQHFGSTFGGLVYSDLYGLIFGLFGGALIFAAVIVGISTGNAIAAIVVGALGVLLVIFGALVAYVTGSVFTFILYEYLNGKGLPSGFDKEMMATAVKQKKQRLAGKGNMPDNSFA